MPDTTSVEYSSYYQPSETWTGGWYRVQNERAAEILASRGQPVRRRTITTSEWEHYIPDRAPTEQQPDGVSQA